MEHDPPLEATFRQSVFEADIDWILCIELNGSAFFRDWFARQLFPQTSALPTHVYAWRSVSSVFGESDVLWLVRAESLRRLLVLIENKIDAVAQPRQFERYLERAQSYIAEGRCDEAVAVLVAPASYRSTDSEEYEHRISYESLRDWFASHAGERERFLSTVFDRALSSRTDSAPADQAITAFRREIWRLARDEFPELRIPEPGEVSATQYWVESFHGSFWIKYKIYKTSGVFGDTVVDLELPGRASDVSDLQQRFGKELDELGARVTARYKSAAFSVPVPRVSPPVFDEPAVRAGLRAASTLLRWWQSKDAA